MSVEGLYSRGVGGYGEGVKGLYARGFVAGGGPPPAGQAGASASSDRNMRMGGIIGRGVRALIVVFLLLGAL